MTPMQYSYVCSDQFLPSRFKANIRSQITGQKCKYRPKEDSVPLNLVMAVKPKHHNFQAKIALNEEDMNKLVLCNILYASISAALTCLVVLFIHVAICALTLRFVYLYRENEGMSSRDCLVLIFHYFDRFLEKLRRQFILGYN